MQCQSSHKPAYMLFYFADYFMHQAMMQAFPHVKRTEKPSNTVHEYYHDKQSIKLIKNFYQHTNPTVRVVVQNARLARINYTSDGRRTKISLVVNTQQVEVYVELKPLFCGNRHGIDISIGAMTPPIFEALISTLAHALWQV